MKILHLFLTSLLFMSTLSASEQPQISKAEKEMAEHKAKITQRCPQQIPITKMMEIKKNGFAEVEGHYYYPYNTEDFNKNAPANWQILTHRETANLKEQGMDPQTQAWFCNYTYKTAYGNEYSLILRDAGPRVNIQ
jgi:hypothetical protein